MRQQNEREDKEKTTRPNRRSYKEKRNENQSDQRIRGRPEPRPCASIGGTGLCQETDFSQALSLADGGSPEERTARVAAGAEQQRPRPKRTAGDVSTGQPAAMFFTDDVKGDYERIKPAAPSSRCRQGRNRLNHYDAERHLRNLIQLTQLARY